MAAFPIVNVPEVRVDPVERVKNMVRHSLVAKPDVTNRELFDRAMEIAPSAVEGLSLRQFHARFRLPVIRHEMIRRPRPKKEPSQTQAQSSGASAPARANKAKKTRTRKSRRSMIGANAAMEAEAMRPDVRAALVEFAVQLEGAEERRDLVRVVAGMDTFVDRILDLARRHFLESGAPDSAGDSASESKASESGSDSKAA
jgi:hypothetical protein